MKYSRRTAQASTPANVRKQFATIFEALHFRHEFARRNKEVMAEGAAMLSRLGLPQQADFGGLAGAPTICDLVIDAYEKRAGRDGELRKALHSFLKSRGVLPVGTSSPRRPFVSTLLFDGKADPIGLWEAFNSVLRFETFAIASLGMRRPVMVPFMAIKGVRFNKEEARPMGGIDMMDYDFPLLIDLTVSAKSMNAYVNAMRVNMNISRAIAEAQKPDDERRPPKRPGTPDKHPDFRKRVKRAEGGAVRLVNEDLGALIRILDANRQFDAKGRTKQIEDFMAKERNIPDAHRDALIDAARQLFYDKLETARWLVANYRELI